MVKNHQASSLKKQICVRLKQLRLERGYVTAKAFALRHRLKVSTYSLHEAGTRSMSFEIIEQYCALLNVEVEWLLTGDDKARIAYAQTVPIIDWSEILLFPDKLELSHRSRTTSEINLPPPSFAVKVHDDSMEPRFPQGALLLVDVHQVPNDREFALYSIGDQIVFKQYLHMDGKPHIRSLNHSAAQKVTQKMKILGKVVQAKINS